MHAVGSQQHIKERVTLQRMRRSSQNQPFLVWTTFRRGLIVGGKTTPRFDNLICSLYTRASQQPLAAPCETRFRKHRRINHTHLSIRAKRCRENSQFAAYMQNVRVVACCGAEETRNQQGLSKSTRAFYW